MFSGKFFPQNRRALRMVLEEVIRASSIESGTYEELVQTFDDSAKQSCTSKLWADCFSKPVLLCLSFVRAEREGDFLLHLSCVSQMLPYFFAAHHPNYARLAWLYLKNMMSLPQNVMDKFKSGLFVARRSDGCWNGIATDMLIETTLMKKGSSSQVGLVGKALSSKQSQRWALSQHKVTQLVSDVSAFTKGKTHKSAVKHKEEEAGRIASDEKDRLQLRTKLQLCINPFDFNQHPSNAVVNIVTGKMFDVNRKSVCHALEISSKQLQDFESNFPESFRSPISKQVFQLGHEESKRSHSKNNLQDATNTFGRLLLTAGEIDIDMKIVLQEHEFVPSAPALFHNDGRMRSCAKHELKKLLKVEVASRSLSPPMLQIVDGCALLRKVTWENNDLVRSFLHRFAKNIYHKLSCNDVSLIFDRYYDYSIKSPTREKRIKEGSAKQFQLTLDFHLPSKDVILNNTFNKKKLICLLVTYLVQYFSEVCPMKHNLVITGEDQVPFQIVAGVVSRPEELRSGHEEADIIIAMHAIHFSKSGVSPISVLSEDTDVLVLLMHYYHFENLCADIRMEHLEKSLKIISVQMSVQKNLNIINTILPAHALSGCDTVCSYSWIGKKTMFEKLNTKTVDICDIGNLAKESSAISQGLKFIAQLYGADQESSPELLRYKKWKHSLLSTTSSASSILQRLPPTRASATENILRAHLQVAYWLAAKSTIPPEVDVEQFGWEKDELNKSLNPVTLPKDVSYVPETILNLAKCGCKSETPCKNSRCSCFKKQLKCSSLCLCDSLQCQNQTISSNGIEESDDESDGSEAVEEE